ncbi:MAG: tRNA 2-thiouridine(34) synthase MnmA [Candidatus Omnitrophota bacterium]
MKRKKKIAVGLSGGVDSSVAAYLLKRQGWEVVGFTLKFNPQDNRCCDTESLYQVKRLAAMLDIMHYTLDVNDVFSEGVVRYFLDSYLTGLTPNPCVFCNRLIKFGTFFDKAKSLGCEHLATGHYVRLVKRSGRYLFRQARDKKKSQEYFLSLVNPSILPRLVFPLGNYQKETVKTIAREKNLLFKERKESQDVCFVPQKSYASFIKQHISIPGMYQGVIRHVNGQVLGHHKGIYYFTYGQREGLGISWKAPLYVARIDSRDNTVYVGERKYLERKTFRVGSLNWFLPKLAKKGILKNVAVKIRYNASPSACECQIDKIGVTVVLQVPVSAITPGQIAAFYRGDTLLGAGIIEKNSIE